MTTSSNVNINFNLAFPKAGVVFGIKVDSPQGGSNGDAPSFHLSVADASGGGTIPFSRDTSLQLADWVRGYTRWLRRARVTASYDENSISGPFDSDLSPEQVLQGVSTACDMIRQRFELYEESILV